MTLNCKYCGKEIDGVLPAPLTCWNCYNNKEHEVEVINHKTNIEINTIGEQIKECEECHEILPIDEFYKTGKTRNKICKSCIVKVNSKRTLDKLTIPQIRKMAASGITAESLSKEINKSRSTCQSMLNSLVKTDHAYYKEKNGKRFYYLKKELAENLLKEKKVDGNSILKKKSVIKPENSIMILDNSPNGIKAEIIKNKGIYVYNVPINDLSKIIKEMRIQFDSSLNFEIETKGENAQIFLSEKQIFDYAYKSLGDFFKTI